MANITSSTQEERSEHNNRGKPINSSTKIQTITFILHDYNLLFKDLSTLTREFDKLIPTTSSAQKSKAKSSSASTSSSSNTPSNSNSESYSNIINHSDRSAKYLNYIYWNSIEDQLLFHALISLSATIMRYHIIDTDGDQSSYSVIFTKNDESNQKLELNLLRNRQITLSQLIDHLDVVIMQQKDTPDLNIIHSLVISSITFQISCLIEDSTLTSYVQVHKGVIALLQIFFDSNIKKNNRSNSKISFLRFYSSEVYDYVTTIFIPPYDPASFQEILANLLNFEVFFKTHKDLNETLVKEHSNLCNFIKDLLPIFKFKKDNISKYPRSVIFSLLKKWYKIFPPKNFKMIDLRSNVLIRVLVIYYQLVALLLNHALPECEYLFTLTFHNYQIQENFEHLYDFTEFKQNSHDDKLSKHIIYAKRFITFLNKRENFYRTRLYLKRPFFDNSVFDKEKGKILSIKKPTYYVKETFIQKFNTTIIKPNNYPHYESAIYRSNYSNFSKNGTFFQQSNKLNIFKSESLKIKDNFLLEIDFDPINDKNYNFKFFSEEISSEHLDIIANDRKGILIEI